jgi:hypothetical protein
MLGVFSFTFCSVSPFKRTHAPVKHLFHFSSGSLFFSPDGGIDNNQVPCIQLGGHYAEAIVIRGVNPPQRTPTSIFRRPNHIIRYSFCDGKPPLKISPSKADSASIWLFENLRNTPARTTYLYHTTIASNLVQEKPSKSRFTGHKELHSNMKCIFGKILNNHPTTPVI